MPDLLMIAQARTNDYNKMMQVIFEGDSQQDQLD